MEPLARGAPPIRVVYGFLDLADGGAQRLTLGACRCLDRARFAPGLLCARGGGRLVPRARAEGLVVRELGRLGRRFDLGAVAVLAAALDGVDVLHVPLYSRSSPYFRAAARRAGTPVVVAHEWSRPSAPRWPRRVADRWLRSGTRFVATSAAQRIELTRAGVPARAVEVVRSGIDPSTFGRVERGWARAELGLPELRPTLLVPARLHPAKGHLDLIAALPELLRGHPTLSVLCAGEGPLAAELALRVAAAGLESSVRFLGQRDDLPLWMAAADLIVLPSRIEGIPAALLEGMAARRAVVATDVGGVGEALADGVEGLLLPAGRPLLLAEALGELLDDPERAAAMGERGRERVEREFRVEASTRRLEQLYTRWLERP